MRILFVGGTGIISSACSRRAVELGHEVYLLCRGQSPRGVPDGARVIKADVRDLESARRALGDLNFDSVADFIAFETSHIETALRLFEGRTRQYVFISSASAYKKPVDHWPITEATPLHNPFWEYSRNKIACEERLLQAYRQQGFPMTVVRPSHTYDRTLLPFDPHQSGYTVLRRMLSGKPIVVHGDGTSLWVLTHHRDFARGFVGLLGHPKAIGEAFHITSDEVLTWNQIFTIVGNVAGVEPKLVHVASEVIAKHHPAWGAGLLGDKAHSVIFDNTKLRGLVPDYVATIPFHQGAEEIVRFYADNPRFEPYRPDVDELMDRLAASSA